MIKYPVGIQTFSEIISEKYLYVDKTKLVYTLANENKYVFLSRPRRFGKSLLMSTLASYFRGERALFTGLEIENFEQEWTQYPVFRFDLSPENFNHPQRLVDLINRSLSKIERDYCLSSGGTTIAQRLMELIEQAHSSTGRKVVVLIDEYDKPMLDCMADKNLHNAVKDELRGFFTAIKTSDEHIRFAMLTGVTRFSKVSIFSGLNNLLDISMMSDYNGICGITETEFHKYFSQSVAKFSEIKGLDEAQTWRSFKEYYDGYRFCDSGENIYNPYSVLSAFKMKDLKAYWYSTGSSSYLVNLVSGRSFLFDSLEGVKMRESALSDITNVEADIVPLLFQAGYLTIKGYDDKLKEYVLGFPNLEVKESFWESLSYHFFSDRGNSSVFDISAFLNDVESGMPEKFMVRLRSLFASTDAGIERNKEIHFQNMVAIAMKMLGFIVHTEVHSGSGRCDMQIFTPSFIYIFEFKIDGSAEKALQQIFEKGYARPFQADSRTKFLIGANFSSKEATLDNWIIQSVQ